MGIYRVLILALMFSGAIASATSSSEGGGTKDQCEALVGGDGDVTNSGVDASGFINLYQVPEGSEQDHQQPSPAPKPKTPRNLERDRNMFDALSLEARSQFVIHRGVFLQNGKYWIERLLQKDPVAEEILEFLAKRAGNFVSRSPVYDRHYNPLRLILKLTKKQLESLSPKIQVRLFSMFTRWNIIPPESFMNRMQPILLKALPQWTASEMREFSLVRIQTSASFGEPFESTYKNHMIQMLETDEVELVFNMMSSEFLRGTYFSQSVMKQYAEYLERVLPTLNEEILSPQRIKEVYRGLLLHRAQGPMLPAAVFDNLLPLFTQALDNYGLALTDGGTSGFTNDNHKIRSDFAWVIEQLKERFPDATFIMEHMDATRPGMFDPVDIYLPEQELVVEWDGAHHYLRPMLENGDIENSPDARVLRPMDVAKDRALRMTGVAVFRVDREQFERMKEFGEVPVLDWIQYQNPDFIPVQ